MSKLGIKLNDAELAEKLEEAGFRSPRQLRNATDKDLKAVLGKSSVDKVRKKFPRA